MRVFGSRLLALAGYLILIAAASPAAADLVDVPSKFSRLRDVHFRPGRTAVGDRLPPSVEGRAG